MTLVLQWFVPEPALSLTWIGPAGVLDAIARRPNAPIAGLLIPAAESTITEPEDIQSFISSLDGALE